MALRANKIAILGDLHGKWNQCDNDFFDRAGYDLLVFLGDLGDGTHDNEKHTVRRMAGLDTPALVLAGNNDAQFMAEVTGEFFAEEEDEELKSSVRACAPAGLVPCGYSRHELESDSGKVTLIAARPCAMGGSEFSFGAQIEEFFGVTGMEHSAGRLRRLVDDAESDSILFVAHNGPFGLGGNADSPWARDFRLPEELESVAPRDWGDTDLQEAVDYAREQGKNVLAVIAGHMHRAPRGDQRPFLTEADETAYINAAVVPRIVEAERGERHHFVELEIAEEQGTPSLHVSEEWRVLAPAEVRLANVRS